MIEGLGPTCCDCVAPLRLDLYAPVDRQQSNSAARIAYRMAVRTVTALGRLEPSKPSRPHKGVAQRL